jgi:NAD(P)-dependent dehydrogenase (short-subunit alcohol dehydrogenase family)
MDLDLTGRCAVVTGGSRGIGKAIARALAAEGCDVGLVARDLAKTEAVASELGAGSDRRVVALVGDTGDDRSVAEMAQRAVAELGSVDILVNTAATPPAAGGPPGDDDLEWGVNVKVRGYVRCARAFAPGMASAGWGRIINIGGLTSRQTGILDGSVRNAAVTAVTKNLADELGPSGINVTVVHPGMTRTEQTPEILAATAAARGVTVDELEASLAAQVAIGRLVTASEVAAVVTFLASPLSVALTGDPIAAAGGVRGSIYY